MGKEKEIIEQETNLNKFKGKADEDERI